MKRVYKVSEVLASVKEVYVGIDVYEEMAIQAFITFSVTNAKRLVRLIEKREREPPYSRESCFFNNLRQFHLTIHSRGGSIPFGG